MLRLLLFSLLGLSLFLTGVSGRVCAQAGAPGDGFLEQAGLTDEYPTGFAAVLATAVSSKMSKVGERVVVILKEPAVGPDGQSLPVGTQLKGSIAEIGYDQKRRPHALRLTFQEARMLDGSSQPVSVQVATADGMLTTNAVEAIHYSNRPSYATLKHKIRRMLSSDQAVWNQVLGVNQSALVDFETDDFMIQYNKGFLLLGVGDELRLTFSTP